MHSEFDMFEDFRITCIHSDCTGYDFSENEEENRDTNEGAWHFYSDPEEGHNKLGYSSNSSRSSVDSLSILQPYLGSSQFSQSLQSQQTPQTSDNLQSEATRNSASLLTQATSLSQLQPIQSSDSASTSHSSISNEAVNGEEPVRGFFGTDVGIMEYGLSELNGSTEILNGHCKNLSNIQFHVHLYQTKIHDALDLFAYGGPQYEHDQYVSIHHMPASPQVCDYTNDLSQEELTFLENVENYLDDKGHPDGVPIP